MPRGHTAVSHLATSPCIADTEEDPATRRGGAVGVGPEARLVVSEPLGDLPGAWNEVPESSAGIVRPGSDLLQEFVPIAP